jgi:hypothetical protein
MSWPLVVAQLRDRHPALRGVLGANPFAPASFAWLLRGRYRGAGDPALNFLALPAQLGAWAISTGAAAALVFGAFVILDKRV